MRPSMTLSVAGTICWVIFSPVQAANTINCEFGETHVTYLDTGKDKSDKVYKVMRIVDGRTADETWLLDGSKRATNSTSWTKLIDPNRPNSKTLNYAGDSGELLTILLREKMPVKVDAYLSTISYTYGNYSITDIGMCSFV